MTHAERLSDGRFNIVLQGLEKFRVLDEDDSRTYRLARVESIAEQPVNGGEKDEMRAGAATSRSRSSCRRPTDAAASRRCRRHGG